MRLSKLLALATCLVSTTLAAKEYQITYYGCPKECDRQEGPSCGLPTYPLKDGGTKYFCALSTDFHNRYCGKRVIVMLTNGSKKMLNVQVVDSCGNCPKTHVDLSSYSFSQLIEHTKGESDVIWGVYDTDGSKLAGPYVRDSSKAAKNFGMSTDSFLSSFNASAKKLAKSGSHTGSLDGSSREPIDDDEDDHHHTTKKTTKKTTTRKTTTRKTTTRKTTTERKRPTYQPKPETKKSISHPVQPKPTPSQIRRPGFSGSPIKPSSVPVRPGNSAAPSSTPIGTKPVAPSKQVTPSKPVSTPKEEKPVEKKEKPTEKKETPSPKEEKPAVKEEPKEESDSNLGYAVAAGGGLLGAAGLGLLLMKKKSPGTYQDMKQKFPEAFSTVKRGLSRSATTLKRSVTRSKRTTVPDNVPDLTYRPNYQDYF